MRNVDEGGRLGQTIKKLLFICLLSLCCNLMVRSQRQQNYIYVFDCTKSMTGYEGAPDIMAAAKLFLWSRIETLPTDATISILLFQDKAGKPITCRQSDFDRRKVNAEIDRLCQAVTNTNICDAWREAEKCIDPEKDNYLMLMTDGADNVLGPDSLAAILSRFCGRYPNTHGSYATLTESALKGLEPILRVIEGCDDLELVDLKERMVLSEHEISVTTGQLPYVWHFTFSEMDTYKAHAECDDPHIKVSIVDNKVADGRFDLRLESAYGDNITRLHDALGQKDYRFEANLVMDEKRIHFSNPTLHIKVQCRPERLIRLGAFADGNELEAEDVNWRQGFLFWKSQPMDTLRIDLAPVLNDEARKATSLTLKVKERSGRTDCCLLVNGREDSLVHISPIYADARLELVFRRDADEGVRHFDITAVQQSELDRLNGQQVDDVVFTITTHYHVVWHIAKWITIILLTLTAIGLAVWFLVLKPIIYPTIKTGKIIVGEPYYASHKIHGAREAVLCAAPVKQGFLNRVFTGRIVSCTSPCWTHPIVCTRGRSGLHVRLGSAYTIDPYSNKLQPGVEYEIQNLETKEKITLQAI